MKWGLALSGGSLRGAAHIGVLSVLEEYDLRPDYIAGTSSGSLVAALYALGFRPRDLESLLTNLSAAKLYDLNISWCTFWRLLFNLAIYLVKAPEGWYRPLPLGLLKGKKLANWIGEITVHKDFADTWIPLAVMCTDIDNGRTVCFHSPGQNLSQWRFSRPTDLVPGQDLVLPLRASTAIPGIFVPVDYQGHTLVDGGVVDNLPSEVLRAMGANRVLAVNLGYAGKQEKKLNNAAAIAAQAVDIMARDITRFRGVHQADLVLNPRIYDVGLTEFEKIPQCVERGREVTRKAIKDIKALLA